MLNQMRASKYHQEELIDYVTEIEGLVKQVEEDLEDVLMYIDSDPAELDRDRLYKAIEDILTKIEKI